MTKSSTSVGAAFAPKGSLWHILL